MRLAKRKMTGEQAFQKVLASVTGQMGEPSGEALRRKSNMGSSIRGLWIQFILMRGVPELTESPAAVVTHVV